jgi:hypothetical protein
MQKIREVRVRTFTFPDPVFADLLSGFFQPAAGKQAKFSQEFPWQAPALF